MSELKTELAEALRKCLVEDGSPAPLLSDSDRRHLAWALAPVVAQREAKALRDLGYWLEKNVSSPAAHRRAYAIADELLETEGKR